MVTIYSGFQAMQEAYQRELIRNGGKGKYLRLQSGQQIRIRIVSSHEPMDNGLTHFVTFARHWINNKPVMCQKTPDEAGNWTGDCPNCAAEVKQQLVCAFWIYNYEADAFQIFENTSRPLDRW